MVVPMAKAVVKRDSLNSPGGPGCGSSADKKRQRLPRAPPALAARLLGLGPRDTPGLRLKASRSGDGKEHQAYLSVMLMYADVFLLYEYLFISIEKNRKFTCRMICSFMYACMHVYVFMYSCIDVRVQCNVT